MKSLLFSVILSPVLFGFSFAETTVFEDEFESGALAPPWSTSSINQGRVTVSSDNGPATGLRHLILDDSVSDAVFSVAEASLALDLTGKKNVVLTFKAKSLGNEPHYPPSGNFVGLRNYDGVAISADGGGTWRSVQSLATTGLSWTNYSITLDSSLYWLGGAFGSDFRIRFSQYDNSSVPLDGLAIDDVKITAVDDQAVVLELPASVSEGSGPHTGHVFLALPAASPLTLTLTSYDQGLSGFPRTIVIPAGEQSASFQFFATDDALVNLTRRVSINAESADIYPGIASLEILDDELPPVLTLTLPSQVSEGLGYFESYNNSSIQLSVPATVAIEVSLNTNPIGDLSVPYYVTIPAGETQVAFTSTPIDDSRIDGSVAVTVTASAESLAPTNAQVQVLDNESSNLLLTLPNTLLEGETGNGTVRISGTLPTPLTVSLVTNNPSANSTVSSVTIPAGASQASFLIVAGNNTLRDGTRMVNLNAIAPGFTPANATLAVRDNEIANYRVSGIPDIVNLSNPVPVTLAAVDVEGNVIPNFSGAVNLSLILPDGGSQSVTPASVQISGATGWTGDISLPAVSGSPLKLRASDTGGNSGDSSFFDVMRTLPLTTSGLVWDSQRGRIYASVPSGSDASYSNKVVSIDPATLQIVGSVTVNQDPGQIVITSGQEALYVALRGNGSITKIKLSDFTVEQNFVIGTGSHGTQFAEDMCPVARQPNLLVVSRYRKGVSPRHDGVAVFDNGIIRPVKTQDHTGSNVIEPSADPNIFFGYNNANTEFGLRRLQLGSTGMTEIEVKQDLISGFYTDMRSAGNRVVSTSGSVVDGALLKRLGSFPASGLVCTDEVSARAFYLEQTSQYSSYYNKIGAYDLNSLSTIRSLSLPTFFSSPSDFIRWGSNGLAFRTETTVALIGSSRLVPSDPATDLLTTVEATPTPATIGAPLTYTVRVTNQGPNPAKNAILSATFSSGQTLGNIVTNVGTPSISGSVVSLPVAEIASGGTVSLTVTATPQIAGSLACTAGASSDALEITFSNNIASKLVSVGFQTSADTVNQLTLAANNLVHDSTRGLLWVSLPATVEAPLGKSIVSINPLTGLISDPIPLNANPYPNSMAISSNGRYLYVGLTDVPEVHRIDLSLAGYPSLRIPLGLSQWGSANYAQDIEPLDGDGTSFLMAGSSDHAAAVYDGTVRRTTRTGIYSVDRVERTNTPGIFIGYNNYTSGYDLTRLSVTPSGVVESLNVSNVISGYYLDLHGVGNRILSSSGLLVDSTTLTLTANLGISGRPCLDLQNGRAYLVNGNTLRAFDTNTGSTTGNFALPTTSSGDWAKKCVRWGLDGFAILGDNGTIFIARWSSAIPSTMDDDNDSLPDAWEAANFTSLSGNILTDSDNDGIPDGLEYFFATSPKQANANTMSSSTYTQGANKYIRLVFPRRSGLPGTRHGYEVSSNLTNWTPVVNPQETVLTTQTVNGVSVETVEALIPTAEGDCAFVRMGWKK